MDPVDASKLVMVTGSTSGIGLAVAKHLHRLGYSVVATYWNTQEAGYSELKRISEIKPIDGKAGRLMLMQLDVRDGESISKAYTRLEEILAGDKCLKLFALINNAGVGSLQPFPWLQRATMRNIIDTNLMGNLLMVREFLPLLIEAGGTAKINRSASKSRILFVSSGLGLVPGPTYATYGLTKAAQIYLTKCLNLELKRDFGVQCVAVIPHNFIKNTNICSQNLKNNQSAWNELRPKEKSIYNKSFHEHMELSKSLEKATRTHPTSDKSCENGGCLSRGRGQISKILSFIEKLLASLRGENRAINLDESGLLEGFELALRLKNPPELIFAGDTVFQLIIGSLLSILPSSLSGLLSETVAPNLYR